VAERLIYLDHAATTPMRHDAVAAMTPYLTEVFANPSGSHRFARRARQAVDESRETIASVIGCDLGEIVFTSCGTESDNMAVRGADESRVGSPVCIATEHHAVLHTVERFGGRVVRVTAGGEVDLDHLTTVLSDGPVSSVSVMAVNNETGVIADLAAVSRIVRRLAPRAILHTDAVQAACWIDLRTVWPLVDTLALSAHKFGGPKGVGVLAVRSGSDLSPLILGGGQERDRRSGTHNVAGIVATAVALQQTDHDRPAESMRIEALRRDLFAGLETVDGLRRTVAATSSVPGVAHMCIPGVESEALLYLLDEQGVCASSASACASGAMEPSHVLAAMGVPTELARGSLRLSFGHTTSPDDVRVAADVIVAAVERVRSATRRLGTPRV
jgi:cysteine desulfurase